MTDRVVSKCDACGQEDDHPRHTIYGVVTFEDPVTREQITMDRSVSRHLDCCMCESCEPVVASAGGKKGMDLVNHITSTSTLEETPSG
jgi:hypothetical protein